MDGLRRLQDGGVNPLSAVLTALPANTRRLVVALSGGRDSMTLLDVCHRAQLETPLVALHIHHGLDPAADDWAAFCRDQARERGIPLVDLRVAVDTAYGGLEAAARTARYQAIADWLTAGDVLVTAHHAEDQAQTVLIQALRGAGMRGLAGMPAWRCLGAGHHWRPWLTLSRDAIAAHAETAGLIWVDDPSNHDSARDRGYIDAAVWPALTDRWPAAARTLSRVAERAAEARSALDRLAAIDLAVVSPDGGPVSIDGLQQLSAARQNEVLLAWCKDRAAITLDHRQLAEIARLADAREHNSPRVSLASYEIRRFDGRLFLLPALGAPPTPTTERVWDGNTPLALPGEAGYLALDSAAESDPVELVVTFRRGGERLARSDGCHQRLKQFCQVRRIPPWIRERLPLIYHGRKLVAVADYWLAPDLPGTLSRRLAGLRWVHGLGRIVIR